MANLIQIKRAITATQPGSLANGELAYSGNTQSDSLFIGNPNGGAVTRIGGAKYGHVHSATPGTVSANAVIITDSGNFIDVLKFGNTSVNTVINSTSLSTNNLTLTGGISANGSVGTSGQVLTSNGTIVYWANTTAAVTVSGSNTQIQFNDSGSLGATAGFTFDKATNTLFVANTITVGSGTLNSTAFSGNANSATSANNATYFDGQPASYYTNATNITSGTLDTARLPATVNVATAVNVGANVKLSTTEIRVGNSTVNTIITGSSASVNGTLNVSGVTTFGNNVNITGDIIPSADNTYNLGNTTNRFKDLFLSGSTLTLGNTTISAAAGDLVLTGGIQVNTASLFSNSVVINGLTTANNNLNVTGTANVSSVLNVGANVNLSTSDIRVGNSSVNTVITGTGIDTDGTLAVLNTATFDNTVIINGQATVNNNLVVNANTTLGDSASDRVTFNAQINSDLMPSANVTYGIGNNTVRWNQIHVSNVHSVTGYFEGSVQVAGDLVVTGNVTTTNVNSVTVSDPMIYLAGNNYSSDLVDIGFVGNYYDGATNRHAGVIRHAADDSFYIFKNYDEEPTTNVIDINDASFQLATTYTYLRSGGLATNSSVVAITANSTVNVAIVANTLTLSSALGGASGGTGLSSYTAEDILVANSSNGFRKLAVGSEGYVLQVSGGVVAYSTLDGGTF